MLLTMEAIAQAAPPPAELQEKIRDLVQEFGLEACQNCLQVVIDEQQQINKAILETSFDGFLLADKEGFILSCNHSALSIFGYDSLVGNHIMSLIGGADPASHKRHFENPPEPLPGSQILTHMRDVPAKHKSGAEFQVTVGVCFLELNSERHYVAFVRDLTIQKRQDELQQATFNASFDPIVVTDAFGIIQIVNQALLDEFGYRDLSMIVGKSISKLVPERYATSRSGFMELFQEYVNQALLAVGLRDREMIAIRSDGSEFPMKVAFQRIKADHIHELHLVGFIRNITDEKKAIEVTKMRGDMRAQEAKMEMERDMTSYFAHELRNPLGAIDSALTTMPDDLTKNAHEAKELHKSIKLCTTSMSQIMNNLLDVRQMEEGQMTWQPSPVDLERLLTDIHTMLLPSVKDGVEFRCVVDMAGRNWVLGDAHRLQQVMTNIATNAIEYTTSGSISLSLRWTEDSQVRFECTDTGPGIPKDENANLFKRFIKRGGEPGTGFGLAIAKHIVDFIGGTICFEENDLAVAPGSTCVAILPLQVTTTRRAEKSSSDKKDTGSILEKLNVLIVDDISMNRKMVKRRFMKIAPNSNILEACTGEDAMKICEQEDFDVIIMDNFMEKAGGVMLGTDAVIAMRSMGICALIIGCSGNDLDQEFRSAGAEFFWGKPLPSDAEIVRQIQVGVPRKAEQTGI